MFTICSRIRPAMSHIKTASLVSAFALLAAWQLWPSSDSHEALRGDQLSTLVNRVWIDAIPSNERDLVDVFAMLDEQQIGLFSKNSAFQGDWSAFGWRNKSKGGLVFVSLQDDSHHHVTAKVRKGEVCAPFDYCLKLKGAPRGAKSYGSMEDWIITDNALPNDASIKELFFSQKEQ